MKIRDHIDIDEVHTDNLLNEVKSKLEKNGFSVVIMNDTSKVRQIIEDKIPDEALVGIDDCQIIDSLSITTFLHEKWNVIINPFQKNTAPKIKKYLFQKLFSTEFYITSPEAITKDGKVIFSEHNNFLIKGDHKKPENIIAFIGSDDIIETIDIAENKLKAKNLTVLEVCPYGLKGGFIDNYGQMVEYHDFMTGEKEKQNTFTIVLLAEEHAF